MGQDCRCAHILCTILIYFENETNETYCSKVVLSELKPLSQMFLPNYIRRNKNRHNDKLVVQ